MKYIRVNDEIKKVNLVCNDKKHYCDEEWQIKDIDGKIADTIEELIDDYVWDDMVVVVNFENKSIKERHDTFTYSLDPEEKTIYGAIWTSKGLIYVAKMNEEGKLELL